MKNKQNYQYKKYNYDLSFCPHCYSKMDRMSGVCTKCGFREDSLNGATNTLAKNAKKLFREDEVVKTKKLPPDVSRKKLLLLTIFTGFVGGHLYYVGRYTKAIIYSVMFTVSLFLFLFCMEVTALTHGAFVSLVVKMGLISSGVYIIDLFMDIARVVFKRFKVPVLAPENKANYDRTNIN